jgi:hypothetical protein
MDGAATVHRPLRFDGSQTATQELAQSARFLTCPNAGSTVWFLSL